jgi:hypothetical protein
MRREKDRHNSLCTSLLVAVVLLCSRFFLVTSNSAADLKPGELMVIIVVYMKAGRRLL